MRISFSRLFLLCTWSLFAQQKIDGVAAVVGNEIILESEVKESMLNKSMNGVYAEDRCKELEEMLNNYLLLYYAKRDTAIIQSITDAQVQLMVDEILDDFTQQVGSQEALLKQYGRSTMGEIREEITETLKNREYTRQYYQILTRDIDASPQEVNTYYEKNKTQLPIVSKEVELARIVFFPKLTETHRKQFIEELSAMKKNIQNGLSFATKAIAYSEDSGSAINGGLIKGVKRGQMAKAFEGIAFALEEGQISEPFETEFGFHIVQLDKRRGQELDLRHILLKPKYNEEELTLAKALADSVMNLITSGKLSFEQAAKKYSEDKNTRFNGGLMVNPMTGYTCFEQDKLPVKLTVALVGVKDGQLSEPYEEEIKEEKAYVLVKLLRTIPPHRLSFTNDYQRLKRFTEVYKASEKLKNWISPHISEVFVKIGQDYQNCSFENNWMRK